MTYVIEKKKFCWHRFKYFDSEEKFVKALFNGNRLFKTTYFDKCVKCGLVRKSWIFSRNWYWAGEKTHSERMAELEAELDVQLKADLSRIEEIRKSFEVKK